MARGDRPLNRKFVALEWDARSVRVVHAGLTRRGPQIHKVFSVSRPADTAEGGEALGRFLRSTLEAQGVSAAHAVASISRDRVILTTLNLPIANADDLPSMVEIQISKELPFPLEEAAVDFSVGESGDKPVAPVLVAAARQEIAEELNQVLHAAGLKADRIGLRPYANLVAVRHLLGSKMPERTLFVGVGADYSEIGVFTRDSIAFSRAAEMHLDAVRGIVAESPGAATAEVPTDDGRSPAALAGSEAGAVADGPTAAVDALLIEVARTIEAYRTREPGLKIERCVVSGEMGFEEALCKAIQARFGFEAVCYDPAASFGWSAREGERACGFSSVLGLVLAESAPRLQRFDFIHPKKPVSQAQAQLRKAPRLVAWAAALAITIGVSYAALEPKLGELRELNAQIEELQKKKTDHENFIKLVSAVQSFDGSTRSAPVWSDVMAEVISLMPPDAKEIVLDRMSASHRDNALIVDVRSSRRELPVEFRDRMEAYRRPGATKPRFEVSFGNPVEDPRDIKYPFRMKLSVTVLPDDARVAKGRPQAPSELPAESEGGALEVAAPKDAQPLANAAPAAATEASSDPSMPAAAEASMTAVPSLPEGTTTLPGEATTVGEGTLMSVSPDGVPTVIVPGVEPTSAPAAEDGAGAHGKGHKGEANAKGGSPKSGKEGAAGKEADGADKHGKEEKEKEKSPEGKKKEPPNS